MCGIFGQITDNPEKINMSNVKILGIMNETRGTTSCGIAIDAEIYIGYAGKESTFRYFAPKLDFQPQLTPYVLGHTRKSSVGGPSEDNAHPFGFGENPKLENGFAFMGAHNGTLYNYKELAESHNISTQVLKKNAEGVSVFDRTKIDSEILLECVKQDLGNFKVLSEYEGGAALAFVDTKNNKFYLYSGASKESVYGTAVATEERPLHVYIVDDTNIYFSSEADPLYAIGGNKESVFQIKHNNVYEFTPGKFNEAVLYPIDRDLRLQKRRPYVHTPTTTPTTVQSRTSEENASRFGSTGSANSVTQRTQETSKTTEEGGSSRTSGTSKMEVVNSSTQSRQRRLVSPEDFAKVKFAVFYDYIQSPLLGVNEYGLRPYWYNMKLYTRSTTGSTAVKCTGVYLFLDLYGYIYLGDDLSTATMNFNENKKNYFDFVNMKIVKEIDSTRPQTFIKMFEDEKSLVANKIEFFVRGIKLINYMDYKVCIEKNFSDMEMSHCSFYPVPVPLSNKTEDLNYPEFYFQGELYTGQIIGLDLEYTYDIHEGNVYSTTVKDLQMDLKYLTHRREYFKSKVLSKVSKNENNGYEDATELSSIIRLGHYLSSEFIQPFVFRTFDPTDTNSVTIETAQSEIEFEDFENESEVTTQNDDAFLKNVEKERQVETTKKEKLLKDDFVLDFISTMVSGYIKFIIESKATELSNPTYSFFELYEKEVEGLNHKENKYLLDELKRVFEENPVDNKLVKSIFELIDNYITN